MINLQKLFVVVLLVGFTALTGCHQEWMECQTRCDTNPEVGPCDAAFPRFYFDHDENKCKEFLWGGCEGVVPFETLEECEECGCRN